MTVAQLRRQSYESLFWLAAREALRVTRLWSQTVLAPVVSSLLFVVVFGLSLGNRITHVGGFDYEVFILPGLVAMAMLTAAYANNSSSIFQARNDRYIDDILAAPMLPWQVDIGLTLGGVLRALMIGGALTAIGAPLLGVPIEEPLLLVAASLAAIMLFASLGVIVGIYAQSWDHHSVVSNLVIQPLAFVGGVFYSVDILPSPWQELSHANPLFYMVDAIRHGFLGAERRVAPGVPADHLRSGGRDVRVVGVAVPIRSQAEAIARPALIVIAALVRARGDPGRMRRATRTAVDATGAATAAPRRHADDRAGPRPRGEVAAVAPRRGGGARSRAPSEAGSRRRQRVDVRRRRGRARERHTDRHRNGSSAEQARGRRLAVPCGASLLEHLRPDRHGRPARGDHRQVLRPAAPR